jgi:hypothetical protein
MDAEIWPSDRNSGLFGRIAQKQERGGPARTKSSEPESVLDILRLGMEAHGIGAPDFPVIKKFGLLIASHILSRLSIEVSSCLNTWLIASLTLEKLSVSIRICPFAYHMSEQNRKRLSHQFP